MNLFQGSSSKMAIFIWCREALKCFSNNSIGNGKLVYFMFRIFWELIETRSPHNLSVKLISQENPHIYSRNVCHFNTISIIYLCKINVNMELRKCSITYIQFLRLFNNLAKNYCIMFSSMKSTISTTYHWFCKKIKGKSSQCLNK